MYKNEEKRNAWDILIDKLPEYAEIINEYISKISTVSGLDDKLFNLIWIAVQTALDYDLAVRAHVPLALKAGATEKEIIGAAAVAGAAAGPKGFVKCFVIITEEIEKYKKME